ncbi:hypothetical protein [Burkholderia alba]|uniref:hypothetical protein n=1 Tax=Burkholderia alba TaxID=2683677 RepID=UPI002B060A8F|nr:hypothetical protein [Burkholderia alba]
MDVRAGSGVERDQDALFVGFANFAHTSGCKSVFAFSAKCSVIGDPRDFEFNERLFFYEMDSQERKSFDLHLGGACVDGWFKWVGVKDEFDSHIVAEATTWLLEERGCYVTRVSLPLSG